MGITHEWNGTVLIVTSDSGTSGADLKGEKGDTGIRGPQGAAGGASTPEELNIADYVVESGYKGAWRYIKWKSNRVECWAEVEFALDGSTLSEGEMKEFIVDLPFAFGEKVASVLPTKFYAFWSYVGAYPMGVYEDQLYLYAKATRDPGEYGSGASPAFAIRVDGYIRANQQ